MNIPKSDIQLNSTKMERGFINMKNNILKKIVALIVFIILALSFNFSTQKVFAYNDSKTVTFSKSTTRNRSKTIEIPNLGSITSISVNTGSVSKTVNGDSITINVSGGSYVDSFTPDSYKDIEVNSGTSYPDSTHYYSSGGYSGTLYKYAVEDNGNYITLDKSASQTRSNTMTNYYDKDGNYEKTTYSWDDSNDHPSIDYSSSDGYSGILYKETVETSPTTQNTNTDGSYSTEKTYTATYTGTIYKEIWETNWVGSYRGYVYGSTEYYYAYTVKIEYSTIITLVVSTITPLENEIYNENNASFIPTISVADPKGNLLTCKYFLDTNTLPEDTREVTNSSTAQLISFDAIDTSLMSEGIHTIKYTVEDGLDMVSSTVKIHVDRTAPTINDLNITSTDTTISILGYATDSFSGIHEKPYRFTVDGIASEWTEESTFIKNNIIPNTMYNIKFEARDNVGHISSKSCNIYTKAQKPEIILSGNNETSITINASDMNPAVTEYQFIVDSEINSTWIKLINKELRLDNLLSNKTYNIKGKTRNNSGIETEFSNELTITTLSPPPQGISFDIQKTVIDMTWNAVSNAKAYYIKVDGNNNPINLGTANTYKHENLNPDTIHTYSISVENSGGIGRWSEISQRTTLPNPPNIPNINNIISDQTSISLFWDNSARAEGYKVKLGNNSSIDIGLANTYTISGLTTDTEYSISVMAYNRGGESSWTVIEKKSTLPYPPEIPENIKATQTITTVTLAWQTVERTQWYEIMTDGTIIDLALSLEYFHENLEPASGHTYRIRACNIGGKSSWSEPVDITTFPEAPRVPTNIMGTSQTDSIAIIWYKVVYGEEYEIELDGMTYITTTDTSFVHIGLGADERHTYRVRAKNISGDSPWSNEVVMYTVPEIVLNEGESGEITLTNVVAVLTNNDITISWDAAEYMAEYIIEVDDNIIDNGQNTEFKHTNLEANTYHTYKIRIKDSQNSSRWCAVLSLETMPNPPDAPENIETYAMYDQIEIRWERVEGAEGYDIEIDGKVMDLQDAIVYMHENLEPGTSHTYRVRAKNITGVTAWSSSIIENTTNPTYVLQYQDDEIFEVSLIAINVQDFSELEFKVEYDSEDLELIEQCGFTPNEDKIINGKIDNTDLAVVYEPGTIIFKVNKSLVSGTSWTGEITNLVFKAKKDGESNIDFIMN